jgi:hypothetical protein
MFALTSAVSLSIGFGLLQFDCDVLLRLLRAPRIHALFGALPDPGTTSYLSTSTLPLPFLKLCPGLGLSVCLSGYVCMDEQESRGE